MWRITLGPEGPTDCPLNLHHPDGDFKCYGIGSTAWKILDLFFIHGAAEGVIPERFARIIWDVFDADTIN